MVEEVESARLGQGIGLNTFSFLCLILSQHNNAWRPVQTLTIDESRRTLAGAKMDGLLTQDAKQMALPLSEATGSVLIKSSRGGDGLVCSVAFLGLRLVTMQSNV